MQTVQLLNPVIRFGVFEADVRSGELRKNGVRVKIQDLPFRALKLLLTRPNEVLTREQFRQALWPADVFVDFDHGISSAINRLRDALGDSAESPIFIETVERRGYRWIAPTHNPAPLASAAPAVPILIKTEPKGKIMLPASPPHRWAWMLVIPAMALIVAAWGFRPFHRSAKAAGSKTVMPMGIGEPVHPASEAEEFYLKGRFYWEKRTPDALSQAVDCFTQAIIRDQNYAPAYVGLADTYNLMREFTLMPASEAYPRALAAAKKAVELDDRSSEAHASLAFALFYGTWDPDGAEREFKRAIELKPDNAVAHHWYATFLSAIGRRSESLREIERAQALDPASKSIIADRGVLLWLAGRRDAGLSLLKQMETSEPDFISPHRYLSFIYFAMEDYPNYLAEWKKEAALLHDSATEKMVDMGEKGYAAGGDKGMLEEMLKSEKNLYERGKFSPYVLAQTSSRLGKKQEAIQYLRLAYQQHDERMVGIAGEAAFAPLEAEPGYRELVAKLGFPNHN
ncbi:MAG TPA: winged helix-turn-helix domain-containing protein [Candidatus Solibacter sp.]|nr:winged helix-turn-helix domain-containing protein [Candidatus Solibacter sp.]